MRPSSSKPLIKVDEEGHKYIVVASAPYLDPVTGEKIQPDTEVERRIYLN